MKIEQSGRYNTKEFTEGNFEPGSKNRVYKNLLSITKKRKMDELEYQELIKTTTKLFNEFDENHRFKISDIKKIHKMWLGKIFTWAGKYRQINLSKGGFHFAAADQISKLMTELEKKELKKYTPCRFDSLEKIIEAIAIVHTELVLIHPFREGNGRVARLVATLMALQAGLPVLDFGGLKGKKRQEYFMAVRAGLNGQYGPMMKIFKSVIKRTLKKYQSE